MHELISDVAGADEPVLSYLSLDSKVPLLHVRLVGIMIEGCKHPCSRIRDILAQCEWERIARRFRSEGVVKAAGRSGQLNLAAPWRTLRRRQIQFRGLHVVEASVAGPDDHLSVFAGLPHE